MDTPNVNNLNGVPNFGHGLPEDGIVIAGVTDTVQPLQDLSDNQDDHEEETANTDVPAEENKAEAGNGEERGEQSDVQ